MRPGREHDTTALRAHTEALPLLAEWVDAEHAGLADLGYEGVRSVLITPVQRIAGRALTTDQRPLNALHAGIRARAERRNSLLKATFKALRRVSLCPGASAPSPPPTSSCSPPARPDHMITDQAEPLLGKDQ